MVHNWTDRRLVATHTVTFTISIWTNYGKCRWNHTSTISQDSWPKEIIAPSREKVSAGLKPMPVQIPDPNSFTALRYFYCSLRAMNKVFFQFQAIAKFVRMTTKTTNLFNGNWQWKAWVVYIITILLFHSNVAVLKFMCLCVKKRY